MQHLKFLNSGFFQNMGGWYLKHQFHQLISSVFSRLFLNLLQFADVSQEEVYFFLSSLELIADLIVEFSQV